VRLNHHRGGSGPPLVLIHGIGSRWQMWEPVLARLEHEHEVIALDLPGFAGSPPAPLGTPAVVPALTRLVSEFLASIGIERPHAAGNSLGGWIVLELAKQGSVRSVTALSPAGFHNSAEAPYQHISLWTEVRAARLLAPRADRLLRRPGVRRAAFRQFVTHPERISAPDAAASVRALAEAPCFDETLPAITRNHFTDGAGIDVPVTIAWGERDRLLMPRQAARAARAIPSARLVKLRDCGHVPTYDDPEQVAEVLLDGSGNR
jgi:pimeloyl-ACP methyl ester carboxylesterase